MLPLSDIIINTLSMPIAATEGAEDTRVLYKKDYANFGTSSIHWDVFILKDGTNVKFANYLNRSSIKAIEWQNLIYCKFINLYNCSQITSIDLSCVKILRVLIIWWSGIQKIDLTPLSELEIVVCGNYHGGN